MNQQKFVQILLIAIIAISALASGYLIFKPQELSTKNQGTGDFAPVVDGKQVIEMTVLAVSYAPNFFKVKANVPVRWEITSSGQPGCASGMIIASGLVDNPIYLNPQQGQVAIVEFTPKKAGAYRFSCSMNMARGTIQVVN